MPRILRHKVLTFPLPNLLPVLPPSFTETAKLKHKETLLSNPNSKSDLGSRSKKINGNGVGRPSVLAAPVNDNDNDDDGDKDEHIRGGAAGSGNMEIDEIGSTVANTEVNGTGPHNPNLNLELKLDLELQAVLSEIPVTDLPAPSERDLLDFFHPDLRPQMETRMVHDQDHDHDYDHEVGIQGQGSGQAMNGSSSSSRSVSQPGPTMSNECKPISGQTTVLQRDKDKDRDREWKEPEVFYIKETGEIFLEYECVSSN
jgi:hypothetical protein